MARNLPAGRKALIGVVALAMAGTLGLMVVAMRPAATGGMHWPRLAANFTQNEKTRTEHKSQPIGAGVRRLEIVTDGSVRVTPGAAGTVSVDATVHAFGSSPNEAVKALADAAWQLTPPTGDTLTLNGNASASNVSVHVNGMTFAQSAYTDFVVQAPPGLKVIVRGDSGSVSVVGMAGADLKTDSGSIEATGLTAALIAEADSGSVSVRDLKGDVKATTDSGSVTVVNAAGAVKAEAGSGSIRVEGAKRAVLRGDHGQIEARRVAGALEAETSTGRIVAEDIGGGAVLTSEHGSIDARRVRNGRLEARSETGTIALEQPGIADVDYDVRTEHGSVELTLPKTAALTVDLKTEHGRIQDELGLPGASERDGGQVVTGRLGNGKHRLTVTSETGSIDLRAAT